MEAAPHHCRKHWLYIAILSLVFFSLIGCKSAPKSGDADSPDRTTTPVGTLDRALTDYAAGRYQSAFNAASQLSQTGSPTAREQATFLAGMSAYSLGKTNDAKKCLSRSAQSSQPDIAGPANATLGLIASSQGQLTSAISYHKKAASLLTGEDRAQNYFHLAIAEQKLGRWSAARVHLDAASRHTKSRDLKSLVRQRKSAKAFTLQFGAYRDITNARSLASREAAAARTAGLGQMQIEISVSSKGGTWYLVQAGRFPDFQKAQSARTRVTASTLIVPLIE